MAEGVDEFDFYQSSPDRPALPRRRFPLTPSDALPPPGAIESATYAEMPPLRLRRLRRLPVAPDTTFTETPFSEAPFSPFGTLLPSPHLYRVRPPRHFFPEYPVPTLYRPCELEVLQIPTNPYARLHRHVVKAIIYRRTTFVGDPTC